MSKHNYSQYSNKNKQNNNNNFNPGPNSNRNVQQHKPMEKVVEPKIEVPEIKMVQETVQTMPLLNTVKGTVAHCSKLNVREKPVVNSSIVCVLDVTSEIEIDISKSTENWFFVQSATGAEGYCMKEYIDAHL